MLTLSPNTDCLSVIFALLFFQFQFGFFGLVLCFFCFVLFFCHVKLES